MGLADAPFVRPVSTGPVREKVTNLFGGGKDKFCAAKQRPIHDYGLDGVYP